MNDIVQYLILELNREKAKNSISVKKYDTNSRRVMATLTSDGAKVSLKDAERAAVKAIKPDGKYIYNDCSIIGDEIAFVLTTQMINVAGDTKAELEVAWKDGSLVTTSDFIIHVYDNISTGIESQNEYKAITQIAAECTSARDEVRELATKTLEAESNANVSAQSAEAARTAAIEARDNANTIKTETEGFKDEAYGYMEDSASSAALAQSSAEASEDSATSAANILASVESLSAETEGYKDSAFEYASNAEVYASNAIMSATSATTEANRAKSEADRAESVAKVATPTTAGMVKPDGETTTVDEDGTIHAVGGGQGASSWSQLTDKPFESIGTGLSVDEEGNLNAEGEAIPENVVYFEGNALKDKDGNEILPNTSASNVNLNDRTTVENKIGTLTEGLNTVNNNLAKVTMQHTISDTSKSFEENLQTLIDYCVSVGGKPQNYMVSGVIAWKDYASHYLLSFYISEDDFIAGTIELANSATSYSVYRKGGGASIETIPFSKCVKGEFTAAPKADGLVEINLGFRPTRVECWFSFNGVSAETLGNQMCAYYDATLSTTQSFWNLYPAERTTYYININASSGETGVSHITDTGFKFRAHGGNILNTRVKYVAY